MKAFAFLHNEMIEESAPAVMSIHLSKEGAEKAMKEHKHKAFLEWTKERDERTERHGDWFTQLPFGSFKDWFVSEIEILP
jgi:chemotaxis response regulator CheB